MLWCDNDLAAYPWPIYNCLCCNERRWVWQSATHDSCLQRFSATDPADPTSGLHDMHFRGIQDLGGWIYRHISRIRYETFFFHRLGVTRPDHSPDFLAFSLIVYLVVRSNVNKVPIPRLLKITVRDATYYFLVIFSSHLVLMMFLLFASVSISSECSTISLWLA